MRYLFSTIALFALILASPVSGQSPFKTIQDDPRHTGPAVFQPADDLPLMNRTARITAPRDFASIPFARANHPAVRENRITTSGGRWIELDPNDIWATRSSLREVLTSVIHMKEPARPSDLDWTVTTSHVDERLAEHIRVQQTYAGYPIYGQDMVLHVRGGQLTDLNGYVYSGAYPAAIPESHTSTQALAIATEYLKNLDVKFANPSSLEGLLELPESKASLMWYPDGSQLRLAYEVHMHPNIMDHWKLFIDAGKLEVIQAISQLCTFAPLNLYDLDHHARVMECSSDQHSHTTIPFESAGQLHVEDAARYAMGEMMADGATLTNDQDLFGINRPVNAYQVGTTYYMIDASRPSMFRANQSVMPDNPLGVIWTIDAHNTSPQLSNFQVTHVTNTNNNWTNLQVSAHHNGGVAYEYFRQTFNRNSINGSGGNIISIINVRDDTNQDMDNAFWNGTAMFYGNGRQAFNSPLAKSLDVAGHEMSHGVIQNTANLEYVGQSGALNESFADIFGTMIDRDDWKLGEDVVNPAIFTSGALRDMSNPNNGGTMPSHPGWQPAHMNQYQNLPNTPEGDNGGVHVNSGIPNRAYFLLATSIGKNKAEQIYYKALRDYLVKSSQFIDARIAVERAAIDLHGQGSAEVTAVRAAFDQVGIGSGQGGNYEEDIEVNQGTDFILATDEANSDLYLVPPANPGQFVKLNVPSPISRPSFTDDGTICVYVDAFQRMIGIEFNWATGNYQAFFLEGNNPQTIWRNVVLSKDGSKIAYTTANLRNEISVFDFNSGFNEVFTLYNPTTAQGGFYTGDVLYADAMEWDYSGEYLMYDALNRIPGTIGGGIEYWDISFIEVWRSGGNQFGSGQVGKLFTSLPENVSVGNPSFAKNSPYIIVFDYLETAYNNNGQLEDYYFILAANIEAAKVNQIYWNNTIGFPSYSRLDNKILFTNLDQFWDPQLGVIDVQPGNKTLPVANSEQLLIQGAQKGIWFTVGERNYTRVDELTDISQIQVYPQPAHVGITIEGDHITGGMLYTLFDMAGRICGQGVLDDDRYISTSFLIPGAYLIRLEGQDGFRANAKLIKH